MIIRSLAKLVVVLTMAAGVCALAERPTISEDRELKEIDLSAWDCRDHREGSATTPDGIERNKLKNRSGIDLSGLQFPRFDTRSFLQKFAAFERQAKGMRRKDLKPALRPQLDPLEKKIVSFTGYLVLAYAGPPESTNCGNIDFHDWHLELFEKPHDHPPQIGDPTPIICEITPRTQNAIFRDNIRMQDLAGFIRAPDLTIEPTGHAARKVRVTGYLLWDDEHNGSADVGTTVRSFGANGYHHPWRSTAWEIHPVIKIEALDAVKVSPAVSAASASPSPPAAFHSPTPAPASPR